MKVHLYPQSNRAVVIGLHEGDSPEVAQQIRAWLDGDESVRVLGFPDAESVVIHDA